MVVGQLDSDAHDRLVSPALSTENDRPSKTNSAARAADDDGDAAPTAKRSRKGANDSSSASFQSDLSCAAASSRGRSERDSLLSLIISSSVKKNKEPAESSSLQKEKEIDAPVERNLENLFSQVDPMESPKEKEKEQPQPAARRGRRGQTKDSLLSLLG